MRKILFGFLLVVQQASAQTPDADKKTLANLQNSIGYLADDKLEGRRTGTAGEKLAYEFIIDQFKKSGLKPMGDKKTFLQAFDVKDGREIKEETALSISGTKLTVKDDFFPLAYSGNTSMIKFPNASAASIKYFDISKAVEDNATNPHFDLKEFIYSAAKSAQTEGKKIFIVYNPSSKNDVVFDSKDKAERLKIPVLFYNNISPIPSDFTVTVNIEEKIRTGHNVVGYINNAATNTIVIGAHYDHLGYGEDHNSLYAGKDKEVHNGADDNASGVAALLELGNWLSTSSLKKYNYCIVAFSGEELGLYGSKYFADNSPVDLKTVNYMLNMDMVGRLNDSTHGLNVGGYGTSPSWADIIKKEVPGLKIKTDSSGTGPSDHTSFYKKDIPVLYFFTGSHSDYHKPTDDANKINYTGEVAVINYIKDVLTATDKKEKLSFLKTRDAASTKNTFKVSIGIMPDYTFDGDGVKVDAVIDNRPAQKAGVMAGDVLFQLGDYPFHDVETYMQALNKFNKGDGTKLKLRRGKEELVVEVVF
ncbi:MAG: M28 family peptidase [Bacteroidetes bacterium]|nr:M28 family peptidase [Bacteroidota bacterium]